MGKASRDKGARFEREIVNTLRSAGLDAYRVPLSGASTGFKDDIEIRFNGRKLRLEAKCRKSGLGFLYDNIPDKGGLVVKSDRSDPLLVIRLADAADILGIKPNTCTSDENMAWLDVKHR